MSFRLLNLSSLYPGHIESFYNRFPGLDELSYDEHYNLLLKNTTEFAGSYTRNFIKLGVPSHCIFANDTRLLDKYVLEKGISFRNREELLFKKIQIHQPEILWIENLNFISNEWIGEIKNRVKSIKLLVAYHCAPYNKVLLEKLKSVDFVFTCTPGLKKSFENEDIKTYHVYHGFDCDLLPLISKSADHTEKDLVFSGSLFTGSSLHNERIRMVEKILETGIGLELYVNLEKNSKIRIKQSIYLLSQLLEKIGLGMLASRIGVFDHARSPVKGYSRKLLQSNHDPLFGIEMYNLFKMSKIVLNNHIGVAGDYAGNMRLFEATGVGSCLLTDYKKNLPDLFDTGNEVVDYDNIDDCIEKINWLLDHEEERKRIAISGQEKTLKFHTVENRCKFILDIIEKELKS